MADAPVENPMPGISTAMIVVGVLTLLMALPGVFTPKKHQEAFMPDSLPSDERQRSILVLFHFMFGVSGAQYAGLLIVAAYACPCTASAVLFLVGMLIRVALGLNLGLNPKIKDMMGVAPKLL
jgi:formate-dependent nitrite reductase membrane component NrfD